MLFSEYQFETTKTIFKNEETTLNCRLYLMCASFLCPDQIRPKCNIDIVMVIISYLH